MFDVITVPCLQDNYAYLIVQKSTNKAILIDAPEAAPVLRIINAMNLTIEAVLFTHHHYDHVDGLPRLGLEHAVIIGNKVDAYRLPRLDYEIRANQVIMILDLRIEILPVDGHTIGHVAFYMPEIKALFSGDSLMIWGCGRLFEGTADMMYQSLERLLELPDDILIFSGHNYGEMNGKFALSLGENNPEIAERAALIARQNTNFEPVVPALLSLEKRTNPFLRCLDPDFAKKLKIDHLEPNERFAHLRRLRDQFKG